MSLRRRDILMMLSICLVYLALMSALALTVDLRFLMNDAVSVVVWTLLGLLLAVLARESTRSGD